MIRERPRGTALVPRRGGGRIALPPGERAWVRDRAEAFVADLSASGYDVVGDPRELLPARAYDEAPTLSDAELLATAVGVIVELIRTEMPSPPPPVAPPQERPSFRHRYRYRRIIEAVQERGRYPS